MMAYFIRWWLSSKLLGEWLFQLGKVQPDAMKLKSMQKVHVFLVHLKLPLGWEISPEGEDQHKEMERSRMCSKEWRSLSSVVSDIGEYHGEKDHIPLGGRLLSGENYDMKSEWVERTAMGKLGQHGAFQAKRTASGKALRQRCNWHVGETKANPV